MNNKVSDKENLSMDIKRDQQKYKHSYIVRLPILTQTKNDAPRCIQVLFMNRKTYDLRGLRFLHVDVSVPCCILQHVEITHKQG